MSHQSNCITHCLIQKEMEAWWNMLNSVFSFLTASTNYALQASTTGTIQPPKIKEPVLEMNLEDFPFFIQTFEETYKSINYITRPTRSEHSKTGDRTILDIKYSDAFEKCCESMHKLESIHMKEYEKKQEEIFGLLSEHSKVVTSEISYNPSTKDQREQEQTSTKYSDYFETRQQINQKSAANYILDKTNVEHLISQQNSENYSKVDGASDSEETIESISLQEVQKNISDKMKLLPQNEQNIVTISYSAISEFTGSENYVELSANKNGKRNEEVSVQIQTNELHVRKDNHLSFDGRFSKIPQSLRNIQKNEKTLLRENEHEISEHYNCKNTKNTQGLSKSYIVSSPRHIKDFQEKVHRNPETLISNKEYKISERKSLITKEKKRTVSPDRSTVHSKFAKGTSENESQTNDRVADQRSTGLKRTTSLAKRYASVESVVKKLIMSGQYPSKAEENSGHSIRGNKVPIHSEPKRCTTRSNRNSSSEICQTIDANVKTSFQKEANNSFSK